MMGISAADLTLPEVRQVVVVATAFHQTMPRTSYLDAIPRTLYKQHKVRRYGFHGTSPAYVSDVAAKTLGKDLASLNMITCHIGNGGSLTAILDGKSFDTRMRMTPLEG